MKIAFFDAKPYDIPSFEKYGKVAGVEYCFFETKLEERTVRLAKGFDGVCAFVNDAITPPVIDYLYKNGLGLVALRCAGYNNVSLSYAKGKIRVFRVPAYSPHAVAEFAMALLLTSVRRTHKAFARTRDFNFSLRELEGAELCGKKVGIIGTGKIGSVFARICQGFGMHVLAHDQFPKKDAPFTYTDLDTLFRESDIISLHCPLTEKTRHMICKDTIEKMKPGVIILNTSRGALMNSADLIQGIKTRKIGAACLDVYEEEAEVFFEDRSGHILEDDTLARLISMPNVILTSHQGYLTKEALDQIARTTTDNVVCFQKGLTNSNEVFYQE